MSRRPRGRMVWACMAWRGDGAERSAAYDFVYDWIEKSDIAVTTSDAGGHPFKRAASRNMAAESAISNGADILIFHDADMVIPRVSYREMIDLADDTGQIVVGFDEYRALGPAESLQVVKRNLDPFSARTANVLRNFSVGGVVAVRADLFQKVGGYDTRFHGWGCEDFAFAIACNLLSGGPTLRTENAGVHLWHVHGTTESNRYVQEHNGRLLNAYSACETVEQYRLLRASPDYRWSDER